MSLEHNPARDDGDIAPIGHNGPPAPASHNADFNYWHSLINEKAAADFLGVTDRYMQALRQRGGGPRYLALSIRCLRYTRAWLWSYALKQARTSTSDSGPGAEAA